MTSKIAQANTKARKLILAKIRKQIRQKQRARRIASVVKISTTPMKIEMLIEELVTPPSPVVEDDNNFKTVKSLCGGNLIVVTSKASEALRVPLFCPLCDLPMKTQDDSNTYKTAGCCWPCDLNWRSNPQFGFGIESFKKFIESDDKWHSYLTKRSDELKKLINIR